MCTMPTKLIALSFEGKIEFRSIILELEWKEIIRQEKVCETCLRKILSDTIIYPYFSLILRECLAVVVASRETV